MQAELIRPNIRRITSQNSQASVETPISNAERKTLNFLIYYWIFVSVLLTAWEMIKSSLRRIYTPIGSNEVPTSSK